MLWRWIWITLMGVVISVEFFTVFDGNPNTLPLTQVILHYVPEEAFYFIWGGLTLWGFLHFRARYGQRH